MIRSDLVWENETSVVWRGVGEWFKDQGLHISAGFDIFRGDCESVVTTTSCVDDISSQRKTVKFHLSCSDPAVSLIYIVLARSTFGSRPFLMLNRVIFKSHVSKVIS